MGSVGGGINTSRASEGVKDGSASKIGVVSREAIWSKVKELAESRSYRPWMQFLAVQRLASDCLVTSSIPSGVDDFSARRVFAARLPNPNPTTVSPPSKMYAQRLTQKHLVAAYRVASGARQLRRLVTTPPPPETPQPAPSSGPYRYEKAEPERSRLVQKIRANPIAFKIVRALGRAMGYGSTRQVAGRRTLAMYEQVCAIKASEDRVFWQGEHLPLVYGLFP